LADNRLCISGFTLILQLEQHFYLLNFEFDARPTGLDAKYARPFRQWFRRRGAMQEYTAGHRQSVTMT